MCEEDLYAEMEKLEAQICRRTKQDLKVRTAEIYGMFYNSFCGPQTSQTYVP